MWTRLYHRHVYVIMTFKKIHQRGQSNTHQRDACQGTHSSLLTNRRHQSFRTLSAKNRCAHFLQVWASRVCTSYKTTRTPTPNSTRINGHWLLVCMADMIPDTVSKLTIKTWKRLRLRKNKILKFFTYMHPFYWFLSHRSKPTRAAHWGWFQIDSVAMKKRVNSLFTWFVKALPALTNAYNIFIFRQFFRNHIVNVVCSMIPCLL